MNQSVYMKFLSVLICLSSLQMAAAQKVIDVSKENVTIGSGLFFSVGGEPFVNAKFVSLVEGTPYFKKDWLKASVIMPLGKEYKDVEVKLNLFDQQLHFKGEKNEELVATTPVREVIIAEADNKYHFIHSSFITITGTQPKTGWYLRLDSGMASLYKSFTKEISENKPYGSATTEQKMHTMETYLIHYNNTLLEIKKIKDAAKVLANKEKELEEYLKTKDDKKLSMDERLKALITHYNTLLKQ